MDEDDQSIASQNAIVAAISGKLKKLRTGIATSKKNGEDTLLTFPPIVEGITDNLVIIRKMLADAKRIKIEWTKANNQVAALGKQKVETSEALVKKDKQIAEMTARLRDNEATAVANHEKLTNQNTALEAANQANLTAKEKVDAALRNLQQQSAAATQQQQAALQAAMAAKATAEDRQQQAAREVAQTKTELGNSQQDAAKMQARMTKLEELKKHQAGLTAALNALNAEIDLANDDIQSLDQAHVDHLGAIKNQLMNLDAELRKIIEEDPGAGGLGGPGMGPGSGAAGSGDRSTEADRRRAAIMATDTVPGSGAAGSGAAGSGDSQRRTLSRSGNRINQRDFDNIDTDIDDDGGVDIPRSSQPAAGGDNFVSDEVRRINTGAPSNRRPFTVNPDPVRETLIHNQERPQQEQPHRSSGRFNLGDVPMKYKRGGTRRRQRGGYIAVKKTRSKSSSSSGRRRTRRSSSSSRSKSTRRRRHRSRSSSSSR